MSAHRSASPEHVFLLDGGFATELEARGHNLRDSLWSARMLVDSPDEVRTVHEAYFRAGAEVCITASYQASIRGFVAAGYTEEVARSAIQSSVTLAKAAARSSGRSGARVGEAVA